MARGSQYVYDPKTGTWTKVIVDDDNTGGGNTGGSGDTGTGGSGSSDGDSSSGIVEKTYKNIELNTLVGTLSYIPTKETIKLKAGDTVKLLGVGNYLSGSYYVKDVTRQVGSEGYTHSATLIRPDFDSLKVSTSTTATPKETKTVASTPSSKSTVRTHTVVKGDNLWTIAKYYYGDGSLYSKIYDANRGTIANPDLIYVGQVLIIP